MSSSKESSASAWAPTSPSWRCARRTLSRGGVPPVWNWKHNIGGRVRTARVDAVLSQEQLAEAIGREPRRIAELEDNDDIPTPLSSIASVACKVSREFVWGHYDG